MPKYLVTDSVTYNRRWIVEAPDEDAAIARVESGEDWDALQFSEQQDGEETTGYSVVPFAESEEGS